MPPSLDIWPISSIAYYQCHWVPKYQLNVANPDHSYIISESITHHECHSRLQTTHVEHAGPLLETGVSLRLIPTSMCDINLETQGWSRSIALCSLSDK